MSFVFAYELLIRSFDSLNIHGAAKLIQTPVKLQKNYTNIVFLSTNAPSSSLCPRLARLILALE